MAQCCAEQCYWLKAIIISKWNSGVRKIRLSPSIDFIISSVLLAFVDIQMCIWYHFPFAQSTCFIISWSASLLVINSSSIFFIPEGSCISFPLAPIFIFEISFQGMSNSRLGRVLFLLALWKCSTSYTWHYWWSNAWPLSYTVSSFFRCFLITGYKQFPWGFSQHSLVCVYMRRLMLIVLSNLEKFWSFLFKISYIF